MKTIESSLLKQKYAEKKKNKVCQYQELFVLKTTSEKLQQSNCARFSP